MSFSEADVVWLAGLLEGEGYFAPAGHSKKWPSIVLAMSDLDVVERCAALFGTKVAELRKRQPHHKPTYRCVITCAGAIEWARRLYPYMGQRRKAKIDEMLRAWDASNPRLSQSRTKRKPGQGWVNTATPNVLASFFGG